MLTLDGDRNRGRCLTLIICKNMTNDLDFIDLDSCSMLAHDSCGWTVRTKSGFYVHSEVSNFDPKKKKLLSDRNGTVMFSCSSFKV